MGTSWVSIREALPWLRSLPSLDDMHRGPEGIFVNPFEAGAIGPDLFRAACDMGLEGMVSKRSDRPNRGSRSKQFASGIFPSIKTTAVGALYASDEGRLA
ncbi:hypothetical protein JQ615_38695 [Bradyrhizobium jicamae]|uniref:ATP-dependent DNA ligase family profile domain-containing protein n=1 Tax=Bradyrhizobium jicamae TaxID=280332 RepID=A0ABS5FWQ2_9BRAD|nr:hypothetical protein [Bradyrhizobium jicamae]